MIPTEELRLRFERDGYVTLPSVVENPRLAQLRSEADRLLADSAERGGARNALRRSTILRVWAEEGSLLPAAAALVGPAAQLTKLTVFDKAAGANWKVPWHQDLTISLAARREVPGFGPWSIKDGVPHVQPPAALLRQAVALRVHLDATPADNGALRVLVGSHTLGKIPAEEVPQLRDRFREMVCEVGEGGAMFMSPLLLHASSPARVASRRRVLHYEFSAYELPAGLEWA